MRPDEPQQNQSGLHVPQRSITPQVDDSRPTTASHQTAAADIARTQIDSIYDTDPNSTMPAPTHTTVTSPEPIIMDPSLTAHSTPEPVHQVITDRKQQYSQHITKQSDEPDNPYDRTHDESKLHANPAEWDRYHSAWQKYYQEYFQRYYTGHIMQTRAAYEAQSSRIRELEAKANEETPEQAMDSLRSQLRSKIAAQSQKVRKSRHFVPIIAGLSVMLVFVFLQYNRIIFAYANAYVSPGAIEPQNIIVDPNQSLAVSSEPRLIIPKINIDVPVIYDNTMGSTQAETYTKQMAAMATGLAWFGISGADSKPGQNGNTVLSGHSSNDWYDFGDLKFVFANLDKLKADDVIYANYKGVRYTYQVTDTKVVLPTEIGALRVGTDKPMLTLITCTPLGTSQKRLLVFAEQISPDPATATAASSSASDGASTEIPGVQSKFLGVF